MQLTKLSPAELSGHNVRKIAITLSGQYVPEVAGKTVILSVRQDEGFHTLIAIGDYSLAEIKMLIPREEESPEEMFARLRKGRDLSDYGRHIEETAKAVLDLQHIE